MKNTLALTLALASVSASAKDNMVTELESGDKWLRGGFASANVEYDFESQSSGAKASVDEDVDLAQVSFITAFDSVDGFTPGIGFSVIKSEGDDNSVTLFDVSAGGLFKTKEQKTYAIFGTLNSSNDDDVRDSLELDMRIQTSSLGSDVYNELSIDAEYELKNDGTTGGHTLGVSTEARFNINPQLEFEVLAGLTLETDTDYSGDISESHDPSINFAGQLNVNLIPSLSLEIGIAKYFSSGVIGEGGSKVDVEQDVTIASISLMTRF